MRCYCSTPERILTDPVSDLPLYGEGGTERGHSLRFPERTNLRLIIPHAVQVGKSLLLQAAGAEGGRRGVCTPL